RIEAAAGATGQVGTGNDYNVWANIVDAVNMFALANNDNEAKLSYDPLKQIPASKVQGKYTYQSFYVIEYADPDEDVEAKMIVLVNTSADPLDISGPLLFPYSASLRTP
ncbi:MAG: hypothetical protein GX929_06560, partial [Clostridiales bacterium]|nr:hypothetical protein [Clostridiales bacterium]